MRVHEFVLQIVQDLLIQLKLALKYPICHPLTLAQEIDDLIEEGVKVHARFPCLWRCVCAHEHTYHSISDEENVERSAGGERRVMSGVIVLGELLHRCRVPT